MKYHYLIYVSFVCLIVKQQCVVLIYSDRPETFIITKLSLLHIVYCAHFLHKVYARDYAELNVFPNENLSNARKTYKLNVRRKPNASNTEAGTFETYRYKCVYLSRGSNKTKTRTRMVLGNCNALLNTPEIHSSL